MTHDIIPDWIPIAIMAAAAVHWGMGVTALLRCITTGRANCPEASYSVRLGSSS
jgi:hypothetical protein